MRPASSKLEFVYTEEAYIHTSCTKWRVGTAHQYARSIKAWEFRYQLSPRVVAYSLTRVERSHINYRPLVRSLLYRVGETLSGNICEH